MSEQVATGWLTRRTALRIVVLAAVYAAGAPRLDLALRSPHEHVTAIWPPTGIAVAALVLYGTKLWPGVFAGAFIANGMDGVPLPHRRRDRRRQHARTARGRPAPSQLDVRPTLERLRDVVR